MTSPSDLKALLERVEAASGADRELDGRIWCWFEGHTFVAMSDGRKCWADYGDNDAVSPRSVPSAGWMIFRHRAPDRGNAMLQGHHAPALTASIDAALALVERLKPGRRLALLDDATAHLLAERDDCEPDELALALLAALLRALIAGGEG